MKISFRKFIRLFESFDKRLLFLASILLVPILGILDYFTGLEFSFSLFYLFPVSITAWFVSRKSAYIISLISTLTYYLSNSTGTDLQSIHIFGYWNAGVKLAFFLIVSVLMADLRELTLQAREMSNTDFITGITNARAFIQQATTELLRAKRYNHFITLTYIDLDNFKLHNDLFGHDHGNKVLKVVAQTLKNNLRQTDITARMGGDEFALLLPETDQAAARISMTKVQNSLVNEMQHNNWDITFSIGVITLQGSSLSLGEVIQKADLLMYTAKFEGKNTIRFSQEG